MYATTWLERLFQSCQRKTPHDLNKDDPQRMDSRHHLLTYEQLPNFGNDALVKNRQMFIVQTLTHVVLFQIWFWAIWETAQFCVMNKLKTSLGKPQETFLALEGKSFDKEQLVFSETMIFS